MIGIITDQHFGLRKSSQIFHDYMEKFYEETFFPTLVKNKIKTLLDLGETFDNRKTYTSQAKAKEEDFIWKKKTTAGWDVVAVNENA